MSVDINWETLTGGPDGQALAEGIRDFIHERFQQISFPKLIRSVKVHAFDFGTVAPEITLKDVCEPLPDFYETQDGSEDAEDEELNERPTPIPAHVKPPLHSAAGARNGRSRDHSRRPSELELLDTVASPSLTRGAILGSTSNFGYFHLPGIPGTTTPLAAVAGAQHYANGTTPFAAHPSQGVSNEPTSPTSSASPTSRPVSRDYTNLDSHRAASSTLDGQDDAQTPRPTEVERNPEDLQVVFHATYSGDVRLSMTADVFLDFPMPSFVGIPLKLTITGITFNGVGVLASIKKRAHLCFLSPEDAEALVGSESATMPQSPGGEESGGGGSPTTTATAQPSRVGALLEEIKIESEMGETGEGKQVLKNVGKIEKFILEQVQRIFEEEFVYPSFWTFLV